MGYLPLVDNMPVKITTTDPANKQILFKNRRCRLYGWDLHEDDQKRLDSEGGREMVLVHQP